MEKMGKYLKCQRGVTLVLMAIILPVMLMLAGLAIDIGYIYYVKNQLQVAADAASLAGAALITDPTDSTQTAARDKAKEFAAKNKAAGIDVEVVTDYSNTLSNANDITVGNLTGTTYNRGSTPVNAIEVIPKRMSGLSGNRGPVHLFIGQIFRIIGSDWSLMSAQASAVGARILSGGLFDYGVFASDTVKGIVKFSSESYTDSYSSDPSDGRPWTTKGQYGNSKVGSNSAINGAINLTGITQIFGDAFIVPGATIVHPESVTGTIETLSPPKDSTPVSPPAGYTGWTHTTLTNGKTLTTGSYYITDFTLSGGGIGTISGDVIIYVPNTLTISGGNSRLVINSGSSLTVYANDNITISGGGIVNTGKDPNDLIMYVTCPTRHCADVDYSGGSDLYGALYAPQAKNVSISGGSDVYGSVIGGTDISISGGSAVHYDESLSVGGGGGSTLSGLPQLRK